MLKNALKVFVQVCRSGSFTKAAAGLYVTPSAVMQQMDALEQEYGVSLFTRTHKGVQPTAAGRYLLERTVDMMQQAGEIRSQVSTIAHENDTICVGTSALEKCRLLYDLWTLYTQIRPDCRIEMLNLHGSAGIPDSVDLIESLNGGVTWMREWDFFRICQVPIGIAMEKTHPLAGKRMLRISDLAGQEVCNFKDTTFTGCDRLLDSLENAGVKVVWIDEPSLSVFWDCAFRHRLLMAPLCWDDILAGLTLRPVQWEYSIPYGILSRPSARGEVSSFLNFIRKTYTGNNPDDIVPLLDFESVFQKA